MRIRHIIPTYSKYWSIYGLQINGRINIHIHCVECFGFFYNIRFAYILILQYLIYPYTDILHDLSTNLLNTDDNHVRVPTTSRWPLFKDQCSTTFTLIFCTEFAFCPAQYLDTKNTLHWTVVSCFIPLFVC